uniref:Protein kinase domain-containing protein n=1 Tax=Mola mola TaxID=94237 RepID=A0A3Q4AVJ7_MOLML
DSQLRSSRLRQRSHRLSSLAQSGRGRRAETQPRWCQLPYDFGFTFRQDSRNDMPSRLRREKSAAGGTRIQFEMVPKFKRHRKKERFLRADTLSSPVNTYKIHKVLGQGVYGKVVECKNVDSKEKMAVKIVERNLSAAAVKEVSILKNLRQLDENKNNLVRFVEHFQQKGCSCLVFEILDMSLYDFLKKRSFNPLRVSEMRVIAQQMLVALNALKSIGLIHGDIKPDNIMLVNHTAQPFKIKLIDFGLAHSASKITAGTKIQAVGYRAPEVMLGCPMNEAIDMWSLGCVLAFMYLGRHLYPLRCEYESMRILPCSKIFENDTEAEDTRAFISLLKHILQLYPAKRIDPREALGHHFITRIHFPCDASNSYMDSSLKLTPDSLLHRWRKKVTAPLPMATCKTAALLQSCVCLCFPAALIGRDQLAPAVSHILLTSTHT